MALPALMAAGAALEVYGKLKSGSAQRRAADNKATALRQAAQRRLAKSKMQSDLVLAQGGADQTSQLSSMLSSGVSREIIASDANSSLDEIAKRAKFESDQILSDAAFDTESMNSDANDISREGRDAQRAGVYGSAATILNSRASYLQGRYGKDAYSKGF